MTPLLAAALEEARAFHADRGWTPPSDAAIDEAERLQRLLVDWRTPLVQVEPDGTIIFEWDAGERGWLQLCVRGSGELLHSAVIEGDEYGQAEPFDQVLSPWAQHLLGKLLGAGQ